MVRNYKRKTDRSFSEEAMNSAIEMVRQGASFRKAALAHDVRRSTLRNRMKKLPFFKSLVAKRKVAKVVENNSKEPHAVHLYNLRRSSEVCEPEKSGPVETHITCDLVSNNCEELSTQSKRSRVFTCDEEEQLVSYLQQCCSMNNGLTNSRARELAFEYAQRIQCQNIPMSWLINGTAGRDWLDCFKSRHKDLKLQKPQIP